MHDVVLIKKLLDKTLYTRLVPYVKEHSVGKESWRIIQALAKYFRSYPDKDVVDLEEFKRFFFLLHTKDMKEASHTLYETIFKRIEEEDASSHVIEDVLKNYITKDYATAIVNKAMEILQDKEDASLEDVSNMVHKYNKEVGCAISDSDLFVAPDLSYLRRSLASPGLSWRLNELNVSIGPIRQGDFLVVAARPETGKTTFTCSEVSHFIPQIKDGRPIVWVNNEEASGKVMARLIQSFFGATIEELESDMEHYESVFRDMAGANIYITDDESGMNEVKKLTAKFDEHNPALIIFDQLDKVHGFNNRADREDIRIGMLYEWARELAKKYCPVIAISQADGSAEGAQWIEMNQLRGSKTDKIGEADAIITIGKTHDNEYTRYINIPKNKLVGGKGVKPELRHGKFEVTIQPEIARYVGTY